MSEEKVFESLPNREDIPSEYKWRLEDLYENEEQWENEFLQVKEKLATFQTFQGTLNLSAQQLYACLKLQDEVSLLMERLYVYAHMKRDEDSRKGQYQALSDRAVSLNTEVNSATSFIVPEILSIEEDKINRFLNEKEELKLYRHYMENILRMKDHILPAEQELLLAQVGELAQAPQTIYTMINNADMTFPVIKDEKGNDVEITHGRFISLLENRNRSIRKRAFESFYSSYENQINTISATLNHSVKKDVFYARIRKYGSALEASLDQDRIPVSVYDSLISTVRKYLNEMYRYVDLRKKALEVDELHMYDIYVPLVKDVEMKYSYPEAVELVKKGLEPLGSDYAKILEKSFTWGWIDVYETRGKRSGAYSWGAYGTHPYVLMNYQPNVDNVFTLAHELGHALHSYYSDQHQPYVYAQYTIFVAEVASTVNESLLMHYMLKHTTDPGQRMYLLNHYLDQFRGTVFRQTMFAEFEKLIHEKVENGEALTPEVLNEIYRELNATYYGPGIVLDPQIEVEWARVPHFYNAFYVYKYATGFSAATALSRQILEEGETAVDRYLKFLQSGSSDYPLELLKTAGVDMSKPEPVEQALQVFTSLVDELEELVNKQ